MLKSLSNEIDIVVFHVATSRGRSVVASHILVTTLWMCTEQNVTVGVPESEGVATSLEQ